MLAVTDQDVLDDAALKVLDRFAEAVHHDGAAGDRRGAERREGGPCGEPAERRHDDQPAGQGRTAVFGREVGLMERSGVALGERRFRPERRAEERRWYRSHWSCQEACWAVMPGWAAGAVATTGRVKRASTSARLPNIRTVPSARTRIWSVTPRMLGRCEMMTTVVPVRFSSEMAWTSADSPSSSRLEFGSSRMTRQGPP